VCVEVMGGKEGGERGLERYWYAGEGRVKDGKVKGVLRGEGWEGRG